MSGHGWVSPLPGGYRARCGGPALCPECAQEYEQVYGHPYAPLDRTRPPQGRASGVQPEVHWRQVCACAACGGDHLIAFVPLVRPGIEGCTHAGVCQVVGQIVYAREDGRQPPLAFGGVYRPKASGG